MPNDSNRLAHTKWNCKYHMIFSNGQSISLFTAVICCKAPIFKFTADGDFLKFRSFNSI